MWATSTSYQNTFNSLLTRLATTMLRFLQSIHQNAPRATFWKRRSHHVSLLSIICMLKNYSSQYKDKGSSLDPCSSHQPYSMSQLSLSISADQPSFMSEKLTVAIIRKSFGHGKKNMMLSSWVVEILQTCHWALIPFKMSFHEPICQTLTNVAVTKKERW